MKLTVVVPVYKTEKYLRRCLDSIINQSLKEIEVIIVNDGSPDNSYKIIEEYESVTRFVMKNYDMLKVA